MFDVLIKYTDGKTWTNHSVRQIHYHENGAIDFFDYGNPTPYFPNKEYEWQQIIIKRNPAYENDVKNNQSQAILPK